MVHHCWPIPNPDDEKTINKQYFFISILIPIMLHETANPTRIPQPTPFHNVLTCPHLPKPLNSQLHFILVRIVNKMLTEFCDISGLSLIFQKLCVGSWHLTIFCYGVTQLEMSLTCCWHVSMSARCHKILKLPWMSMTQSNFFILNHVSVACRGRKSWVSMYLLTKNILLWRKYFSDA